MVYEASTHNFDVTLVDKNAVSVLSQLTQKGYQAYVVGGAIRDQLLNIPSKDCDVATNAKPEKVVRLVKRSIIVGRRFKIVHARFGRDIIEISTFRSNISSKKRKITDKGLIKRDNIYGTIEQDVMRRDFTVNALYYDYRSKTILDFVGGMEDLVGRKLRSIGDPMERFPEDPVRILRAIRFAAKLDLKVDETVLEAIDAHKALLGEISGQRLFAEIIKLYYSGCAHKVQQMLVQTRVMETLIPEVVKLKHKSSALELFEGMAVNADKRYQLGKRLSVVYLFGCLYWPIFISTMAKKRLRHFSTGVATQVLLDSGFEIPVKTREDIIELWQNQYLFKGRDKNVKRLLKSKRLRASYELLCQRAALDPAISDLALYWSEYIHA